MATLKRVRPGSTEAWVVELSLVPLDGDSPVAPNLTGAAIEWIFRSDADGSEDAPRTISGTEASGEVQITDPLRAQSTFTPDTTRFGGSIGIPAGSYRLRWRVTTSGGDVYTHPDNPADEQPVQVTEY